MLYEVIWDTAALTAAEHFMIEDPQGVLEVFDRTDALAHDPRPETAAAWGDDHWRIRIGDYRVLYEVTDRTVTVDIIHLGHVP